MKFTVTFDCTPEEARNFFGLPDVAPMQNVLMQEMEERTLSAMRAADPQQMMKNFLPGYAAFEEFQKMFWGQLQGQFPAGLQPPALKDGTRK